MKDKIIDFFLTHGFKIMVSGFSVSAIGIILYIKTQQSPGMLRQLGVILVFTGLSIYIMGRIAVFSQNRRLREQRKQEAERTVHKDSAD